MSDRQALPEGTVTVLFTDLVGSTQLNQTLGDEAANAVEREVESFALEQVEQHRGVVVKDTGDGLMAAFQSARRAVSCAQEIQQAMARRNRTTPDRPALMRIGLHTGEVLEEDGNLHGETVIVAKRIEDLAPPGGIFASDTTHGVLGTARAELQDRGEFELKGIETPWRLYEVPCGGDAAGEVLAPGERTPYVGRTTERERLLQLIERAKGGFGAFVLIGGEAGVGKTRLSEELAERARGFGYLCLSGRCPDMEGVEPYTPLIQQIEHAARSIPLAALRQAIGENAPELAKLMPELRRRYDDIPEPVELPPDQERRYLLHGVGEFVERTARTQPLLLAFEDLHWADQSTLLLLRHLAWRVGEMPVVVVGTYRHTDLHSGRPFTDTLPILLREKNVAEFHLARLDEAGVTSMIEARAGKRPPPELVSLVYSETEGNPFFVEELFRHLIETGKLLDAEGEYLSGIEIADTEVPRGVSLILGHRIDQVSEACRRALTAAAILGRTFRFDLVTLLRNQDEDELLDAMEEAEKATLIEDASEGREAKYGFVHEQIRQTLLSMLSVPRRQRLHLRAADALETTYGNDAPEHAVEIAHHLNLAGASAEPQRTAHYLELAGRKTMAALGFEDALRHFEAARAILPADDREVHARILGLSALALRGAARIEDALSAFAEAVEIAPDRLVRDEILHDRSRLLLDLFRGSEAIEDLDALLAHAIESGDTKRELDALLGLGRANYILSLDNPTDFAEAARDAYDRAYQRAKEVDNKRVMAQSLIPTSWFTDYWLDYKDQAFENLREAFAIAEELGDEDLLIEARAGSIRTLPVNEQVEEGEAILALLEARRDPLRLREHYFWLMWLYWIRGELESCVEICNKGIALSAQLGTEPVQYPTIKAMALMDLGRFDEAWASLQEEVADEDHRFGAAVKELGISVYLERVGAYEASFECACEALKEARALKRTWMQRWLVDLLEVLAARRGEDPPAEFQGEFAPNFSATPVASAERKLLEGDPQAAFELVDNRVSAMEGAGLLNALCQAQDLAARSLDALGRCDEAADRALEALVQIDRVGYRRLSWRLYALRARALAAAGQTAEADSEREKAREILGALAESIPNPEHRAAFEADPEASALREAATT